MSTATADPKLYRLYEADLDEALEPARYLFRPSDPWQPWHYLQVLEPLHWNRIARTVQDRQGLTKEVYPHVDPVPSGGLRSFWMKQEGPYASDRKHEVRYLDTILVKHLDTPQEGDVVLYRATVDGEAKVRLRKFGGGGQGLRMDFLGGVRWDRLEDVELLGVVVAIYRRSS